MEFKIREQYADTLDAAAEIADRERELAVRNLLANAGNGVVNE